MTIASKSLHVQNQGLLLLRWIKTWFVYVLMIMPDCIQLVVYIFCQGKTDNLGKMHGIRVIQI